MAFDLSTKGMQAAVIGDPIGHSLSPYIHLYWLQKRGLRGHYRAIAVKTEELEGFVAAIKACAAKAHHQWRGFNITLPHKVNMRDLCDALDEDAKQIGAVNTVVIDKGRLIGKNTDAYGFMENIKFHPFYTPQVFLGKKAVILGAGGASNAVLYALLMMGFKEIIISNRTMEKNHHLQRHFAPLAKAKKVKLQGLDWSRKEEGLAECGFLVNTTALGMTGMPPLKLDLTALPLDCFVTDIIYRPLMSELLIEAKKRGNPVQDGLGMLLYQAAPGFGQWYCPNEAYPVPDKILRNKMIEKLLMPS